MALFPRVQRPCPYKSDLSAVMDGDFCRMCNRNVVDLTAWSDAERVRFLSSCETEICVSYRLPLKPALVAAAMAASVAALPAAAQDAPPAPVEAVADAGQVYTDNLEIIVGGISTGPKLQFLSIPDDPADAAVPDLPVVYDEPAPVRLSDGS
jgi:predicted Fe-S protein YdhL (DUF1289 family)